MKEVQHAAPGYRLRLSQRSTLASLTMNRILTLAVGLMALAGCISPSVPIAFTSRELHLTVRRLDTPGVRPGGVTMQFDDATSLPCCCTSIGSSVHGRIFTNASTRDIRPDGVLIDVVVRYYPAMRTDIQFTKWHSEVFFSFNHKTRIDLGDSFELTGDFECKTTAAVKPAPSP